METYVRVYKKNNVSTCLFKGDDVVSIGNKWTQRNKKAIDLKPYDEILANDYWQLVDHIEVLYVKDMEDLFKQTFLKDIQTFGMFICKDCGEVMVDNHFFVCPRCGVVTGQKTIHNGKKYSLSLHKDADYTFKVFLHEYEENFLGARTMAEVYWADDKRHVTDAIEIMKHFTNLSMDKEF